jgi:succinyl-CoA synthetase beta subunit
MNIHEYQAKAILREFEVPVPRGIPALSVEEADKAAHQLGGPVWVVKAQIHAGGRGKAGGVRLVRSEDEVAAAAKALIGKKLVTHQTGPEGREVKRVYVETGCDIARELYLALSIDRATGRITLIASAEGGVEIEELAARAPDKILREAIDPAAGLSPFYARRIAFALGLTGPSTPSSASTTTRCSAIPMSKHCATRTRRTRSSWRRASTPSTTSSSTAISAAWSTAPGWRWRRWTS